jgi:hypothetical protein
MGANFLMGDGCALLLLSEDQRDLTVGAVHVRDPRETEAAQRRYGGLTLLLTGSTLAMEVVRSRRPVLRPHIDLEALERECSPEGFGLVSGLGIRSLRPETDLRPEAAPRNHGTFIWNATQ